MKLFHETTISLVPAASIFVNNLPKTICILSDIHYTRWLKDWKFDAILHKMRAKKPDYIFIPGDLVDNNEEISTPAHEKRLLDFLKALGKIAPTLISPGNHDAYRSPRKNGGIAKNPEFIAKVNQLPHVSYLSDQCYEDDHIFIFGYNQKPDYYDAGHQGAHFAHPIDEDADLMVKDLQKIKTVQLFCATRKAVSRDPFHDLPQDKLKFALVHSPVHLGDPRIRHFFAGFDYLISGHMHNGVVLPGLFELWRSDRGIIAPGKRLFPKNARLSKKTLADKKIISGAITNFSKSSARWLNAFYPVYFTTLNFDGKTAPKIRRKYRR